jgi:hypothetical protein
MANAALPMQCPSDTLLWVWVQPFIKSLSSLVFFNFIYYLAPPRQQVGGRDPRDALGRRPSAEPRRWCPASGPVAGAQMGIIAGSLCVINYHTRG